MLRRWSGLVVSLLNSTTRTRPDQTHGPWVSSLLHWSFASVELCWQHFATINVRWRAKFLKSRVWHRVPKGSTFIMPRPCRGHFGIARSVRLSVPWRSCLGYRHAGCLQRSHRRPPEVCGVRICPRTDVDPPRFLPPSKCHRRGHIVSPPRGRYLVFTYAYFLIPQWLVEAIKTNHDRSVQPFQ